MKPSIREWEGFLMDLECTSLLLGWGSFAPETSGMSCAPDWESPDNLDYTIFLFVLGFIVPMVVILVTSIRVTLTLKNNSSKAHNAGVVSHAKRKEDKVNDIIINNRYISVLSDQNQVNKTLLTIIAAYLICWSPYAVRYF